MGKEEDILADKIAWGIATPGLDSSNKLYTNCLYAQIAVLKRHESSLKSIGISIDDLQEKVAVVRGEFLNELSLYASALGQQVRPAGIRQPNDHTVIISELLVIKHDVPRRWKLPILEVMTSEKIKYRDMFWTGFDQYLSGITMHKTPVVSLARNVTIMDATTPMAEHQIRCDLWDLLALGFYFPSLIYQLLWERRMTDHVAKPLILAPDSHKVAAFSREKAAGGSQARRSIAAGIALNGDEDGTLSFDLHHIFAPGRFILVKDAVGPGCATIHDVATLHDLDE
jgi:hypothetical protein